MILELPYPPSVNHYYRHWGNRVMISHDGRVYRERVLSIVSTSGEHGFTGKVVMTVDLYPPDLRRRDIDNTLKALQDALTAAHVYKDDSDIFEMHLYKREPLPPDGLAVVKVEKLT